MGHQALTLMRHLLTREKTAIPGVDFALLMERIALAGKLIARELARASLSGDLGFSGDTNVQGEKQKKLDEWTNHVFLEVFEHGDPVCSLISEEMEHPKHWSRTCRAHQGASYAVICDPLDGSSNTDVNGSLGTIFSVRRRAQAHGEDISDLMQPGLQQLAAGYIVYGPATQLVYTAGAGVDIFTLDPSLGEFVLWKEKQKMPPSGVAYAVNQGNFSKWHPGAQQLVHHLTSRKDKRTSYAMRYSGAFVADFHRCLLEGGIYFYPGEVGHDGKTRGKLRLMYELAPLAMIAEQAGGRASTGKGRILEVTPDTIHDRVPIYIGSAAEVALAEEMKPER